MVGETKFPQFCLAGVRQQTSSQIKMPILPNNLIQLLVSYGTTDQNTIANIPHLDFD